MSTFKKIGLFFASIAPGLFLIGYNIGTGSITTMASSGASYGMTLIWPLLLSCIFTYFLVILWIMSQAMAAAGLIGIIGQFS